MAKKSEKEQTEAGFECIEHALTKTERFIEKNQNYVGHIQFGFSIRYCRILSAGTSIKKKSFRE